MLLVEIISTQYHIAFNRWRIIFEIATSSSASHKSMRYNCTVGEGPIRAVFIFVVYSVMAPLSFPLSFPGVICLQQNVRHIVMVPVCLGAQRKPLRDGSGSRALFDGISSRVETGLLSAAVAEVVHGGAKIRRRASNRPDQPWCRGRGVTYIVGGFKSVETT